MLTWELAIAEYESRRVVPDRLTRRQHARYGDYAERMLLVYRHGVGRTRRDLHRSVHAVFASFPMFVDDAAGYAYHCTDGTFSCIFCSAGQCDENTSRDWEVVCHRQGDWPRL